MTAASALHVGIIGLGNIGGNMAANLLKQGFQLSAYDIEAARASAVSTMGGLRRDSVQDLARHADVIITSLPGPQQLEAVMFGDSGVLAHAKPGTVWLDTGTNSIETMTAISARAGELGIESIAAPVSGGVHAAETGTLSIFVGGNAEAFAKIKGILEAVGEQIHYVGKFSNASILKLLINYLCFVNTKAIGEVLALGKEVGIDLNQFVTMAQSSAGNSWVMEKLVPAWLQGGSAPGFTLNLAYKDACLINELNERFTAAPLESGERLCELFDHARSYYGGEENFVSIVNARQ